MNTKIWAGWLSMLLLSILIFVASAPAEARFSASGDEAQINQVEWETYSNPGLGYTVSYPATMLAYGQGGNTLILAHPENAAGQAPTSYIYIAVAPPNFPSGEDLIFYFDPALAGMLLQLPTGGSTSINGNGEMADGLIYTRQVDVITGGQSAATFVNEDPWQFPEGTREIRYLVKANEMLYVTGGFLNDGAADEGAITEALFHEIVSTLQLIPIEPTPMQ